MTISPELEAQILRYYHVERWRAGTIARQLHVHHGTVARVLAQTGLPRIGRPRPSRIDPYLPFILATLEKFPTLTASRLYAMVRERGYRGGPDHFRHVIGCHRPRPKAEAYLAIRQPTKPKRIADGRAARGLCPGVVPGLRRLDRAGQAAAPPRRSHRPRRVRDSETNCSAWRAASDERLASPSGEGGPYLSTPLSTGIDFYPLVEPVLGALATDPRLLDPPNGSNLLAIIALIRTIPVSSASATRHVRPTSRL